MDNENIKEVGRMYLSIDPSKHIEAKEQLKLMLKNVVDRFKFKKAPKASASYEKYTTKLLNKYFTKKLVGLNGYKYDAVLNKFVKKE